jgi:hypothetical protein
MVKLCSTDARGKSEIVAATLVMLLLGACSSANRPSGPYDSYRPDARSNLMEWATGTPDATSTYHSRDAACRMGYAGRTACSTDERAGSAHVSGEPLSDRGRIPGRGVWRPVLPHYQYDMRYRAP